MMNRRLVSPQANGAEHVRAEQYGWVVECTSDLRIVKRHPYVAACKLDEERLANEALLYSRA